MNPRLEVRLLAHGIDAVTLTAGPRRRRARYGRVLTLALSAVALLALLAGWR